MFFSCVCAFFRYGGNDSFPSANVHKIIDITRMRENIFRAGLPSVGCEDGEGSGTGGVERIKKGPRHAAGRMKGLCLGKQNRPLSNNPWG